MHKIHKLLVMIRSYGSNEEDLFSFRQRFARRWMDYRELWSSQMTITMVFLVRH